MQLFIIISGSDAERSAELLRRGDSGFVPNDGEPYSNLRQPLHSTVSDVFTIIGAIASIAQLAATLYELKTRHALTVRHKSRELLFNAAQSREDIEQQLTELTSESRRDPPT